MTVLNQESSMSTRMKAAIVVALIMSSGSAFAAAMDHDPTTGLNTYYYYGPVSELAKKGLPMKDGSSKYTSSSQSSARRQAPSSLRLLENRPAHAIPVSAPASGDKASGNLW
jgi:hypothetical protein